MLINTLFGTAFIAGLVYSLLVDMTYLKIYLGLLIPYTLFTQVYMKFRIPQSKRKLTAIATWNHPTDPTVYLLSDYKIAEAKAWIKASNEKQSGDDKTHITLTHYVTKALGLALHEGREDIGRIVFGYYHPADSIGVTVLCDREGKDLIPVTVWDCHKKTVEEIARDLNSKVGKAKTNKDKEFNDATKLFKYVPTFILQPLLHFAAYFAANLGIEIPGLGCKVNRMGHVLLSNVGMMDIDYGFAPLCSPTFTQIVACMGKISKKPMCDEKTGEIKAEEVMSSVLTFDHRFGDGVQGSRIFKKFKKALENPEIIDQPVADDKKKEK